MKAIFSGWGGSKVSSALRNKEVSEDVLSSILIASHSTSNFIIGKEIVSEILKADYIYFSSHNNPEERQQVLLKYIEDYLD